MLLSDMFNPIPARLQFRAEQGFPRSTRPNQTKRQAITVVFGVRHLRIQGERQADAADLISGFGQYLKNHNANVIPRAVGIQGQGGL